jgi:hypothetical protein
MTDTDIILFAPLNWGLGHATRIVPLINNYMLKGNRVVIAGSGASINFLKLEFPTLEFIYLSNFKIRYAPKPLFIWFLLLQMPFFYLSFWVEYFKLKRIINRYKITTVISDNRYGLWSKKVRSIIITHQIFIQLPKLLKFIEPTLHFITRKLINRFNECWVPDFEDIENSLSGKLSHGFQMPNNIKYIGPLSRSTCVEETYNSASVKQTKRDIPDILIVISGPEPQRTQFELEMEQRFANTTKKVLMVCGNPQPIPFISTPLNKGVLKIEHLNSNELKFYFTHTSHIISRSGYSTIMDLHALGVLAELIPTPGQTEQEYLAKWYLD